MISAIEIRYRVSVGRAIVRNAFLNMLAYRLRYFTGIVTYLLFVSVHYFIWSAVYAGHPPGAVVRGFTLEEMVSYIAVGWIARSLYFSNVDYEINELVRSGQISVYLLRPVQLHLIMLCHAAGESIFRLLFFTVPISAVILWLFPVAPPADFVGLLLFLLATVFSFLILLELNFFIGLLAFYLQSIEGIIRAKYFLVQLLSGLLLPLAFFPDWIRWFVELLPFQTIAYVPLQFYLGKLSGVEAVKALATQLIWFLAFLAAGAALWRAALRKLTLQGG